MKSPLHAKNRFKKRLGYDLSDVELAEINSMIENVEEGVELTKWREGNDLCVYKVNWKEFCFYAVFSLIEKRVITFKTIDDDIFEHKGDFWDGDIE